MKYFCLTILGLFISQNLLFAQTVLINEIDADQTSTDAGEFIELYDGGAGNTALDNYVLVWYNGSDDQSYEAFDLDGYATDVNGFFVIGNAAVPGVALIFSNAKFQNGADAVALYQDDASNFPNDTPITLSNIVDAVVYDTNDGDDAGLLVLLNSGQPQLNEDGGSDGAIHSLQRYPDGGGGSRNTSSFVTAIPTPGAPNTSGATGIDGTKKRVCYLTPNPYSEQFCIESDENIQFVHIYNDAGDCVLKVIHPVSGSPIPAGELPDGIYVVKITLSDGTTQMRKILKK